MRDYDLLDEGHKALADDTTRLREHIRDFAAVYGTVVNHSLLDDLTAVYGRLALQLDIIFKDHSTDAEL